MSIHPHTGNLPGPAACEELAWDWCSAGRTGSSPHETLGRADLWGRLTWVCDEERVKGGGEGGAGLHLGKMAV